jgi:hypothetical protein
MIAPFRKGRCLDGRAFFRLCGVVLLASLALRPAAAAEPARTVSDARARRLQAFFEAHRCPGPWHIADYLRAADTYGIDYRLLPALSLRESTCGRYARANNRWGWNSAKTGFTSVRAGIDSIARELALGGSYRGKTLDGKLRAYNPNPLYAVQVRKLMREIDADEAACPPAATLPACP